MNNVSVENIIRTFVMNFAAFMRFNIYVPDNQNIPITGKLGFWGIGIGSEQGTIEIKEKVRGNKKALNAIIKDIKERATDIETVVISHCQNAEFAENLKNTIQNIYHTVEVKIMPSGGLCSYYAEKGGLIIGF